MILSKCILSIVGDTENQQCCDILLNVKLLSQVSTRQSTIRDDLVIES